MYTLIGPRIELITILSHLIDVAKSNFSFILLFYIPFSMESHFHIFHIISQLHLFFLSFDFISHCSDFVSHNFEKKVKIAKYKQNCEI